MVRQERQQRRGRNRGRGKDVVQQETPQQQDSELGQKFEGQTSEGEEQKQIQEQEQAEQSNQPASTPESSPKQENEVEDKIYYYEDRPMNGYTVEKDDGNDIIKERSVRFSVDESDEEQEQTKEQSLSSRSLDRRAAFRRSEDIEAQELRKEEAEKIRNSSVFGLVQKVFTFFFPAAIKRFVSTSIQCIGGVLISSTIIACFIWLFFYFGECDQQLIETSEVPDNMIYCQERLLAQQSILEIDVNGIWSNEEGYNERRGGPWQVNFNAYQATEDIFEDTTDQLLNKSAEFIANMQQRPFFDIFQQAFFLEDELSRGTGSAVLENKIELQTVFDNHDFTGFKVVNLKKGIEDNFKAYTDARLNSSWELLPGYAICSQKTSATPDYSFQNHWICGSRSDYDNTKTADFWIDGMRVRTISYQFYPIIMEYLYPGSNFSESYREAQEEFKIEWDFAQLFGYDYCNNAGREMCFGLLNDSKSLGSGGPQAYKDFPYYSVSDFIDILNRQKTLTPSELYDASVAERTVYINNLKQFGFFAGKDYISKPQGYESEDGGLLSEDGKTVEYIIVPQLTLATPTPSQTTLLGKTYYVCESCNDRQSFLELVNFDYDRISGLCKKSAYLYLHLYAYAFDLNITSSGITDINQEFSVENNYVTTFLYRLDGTEQSISYFTRDYRNQESLYYYNTQLSELQELHCDASEWAFKDDLNITIPFTLTTGIFSCEVEYCPDLLERFGNAQANVQLLYLGILLFLVATFLCAILPQARSKDPKKKESFSDMLYESITGAAEGMA